MVYSGRGLQFSLIEQLLGAWVLRQLLPHLQTLVIKLEFLLHNHVLQCVIECAQPLHAYGNSG